MHACVEIVEVARSGRVLIAQIMATILPKGFATRGVAWWHAMALATIVRMNAYAPTDLPRPDHVAEGMETMRVKAAASDIKRWVMSASGGHQIIKHRIKTSKLIRATAFLIVEVPLMVTVRHRLMRRHIRWKTTR